MQTLNSYDSLLLDQDIEVLRLIEGLKDIEIDDSLED